MLKKARRLTTQEVREVLKSGRTRRASYLSLKIILSPTPLKTSVIVPKSVAKRAVERNRLRRAAYHALEGAQGQGKAIVFVQKKPVTNLQGAFREDFTHLLQIK